MKKQKGFTLIELLIVVAIILIIAAIAIPNLMRSKAAGNEASAVGSLRSINTACVTYSVTYGTGFPANLSNLQPAAAATSSAADLLDNVLANGTKSGYTFTYVAGAPVGGQIATYSVTAVPVSLNQTGMREFFTDQSGVIRFNTGTPATVTSTPIS